MKLKLELEHETLRVAYKLLSDRIEEVSKSIQHMMKDKNVTSDELDVKFGESENLRKAIDDIGRLKNEFSE